MKILKIIPLLLLTNFCLAISGPVYKHENETEQKEWEHLYQELSTIFKGNVIVSSVTITSGSVVNLVGSTNGSSACTGCVGEVIESKTETDNNCPATGVWGDLTSISLTPGDWEVAAGFYFSAQDFSASSVRIGISATSGNSDPGGVEGWDQLPFGFASATNFIVSPHMSVQKLISVTTTTYLKIRCAYPGTAPITRGYALHARRMR